MMRFALTCTVLVLLTSCSDDRVACSECTIDVDTVLTLGHDRPGDGIFGSAYTVVEDGRGNYWVSMQEDQIAQLFDSTGATIGAFAKKGNGPGEYHVAQPVAALPGDSVLVTTGERFDVVGPDRRATRSFRMALRSQLIDVEVVEWPTAVVTAAWIPDRRGNADYRYAVVDVSGPEARETRVLWSATLPRSVRLETPARGMKSAGYAAPDHIWLADQGRYILTRFSLNETTPGQQVIRRDVDWFPPHEQFGMGSTEKAPEPSIFEIHTDPAGRLWAYIRHPRPDAREAWRAVSGIPPGATEVPANAFPPNHLLWNTLVEVIDPVSGNLIARRVLDAYTIAILTDGRIATYGTKADGTPEVKVLKLTLNGM